MLFYSFTVGMIPVIFSIVALARAGNAPRQPLREQAEVKLRSAKAFNLLVLFINIAVAVFGFIFSVGIGGSFN